MFTGFEDNGEVLNDAQKIRLLFQKVQAPVLTQVKSALQVQHDLDAGGTSVTYNFIANSMAATATNLTEVARSNVSGWDSQGGKDLAPESGVRDKSGTACTGYYPNWMSVSDKDK
jgi:hypothetical protein